jgi:predicted double-glycine peptidase
MLKSSPVWVAGNWHNYNHVVVVMEADENKVTFADPWSDVGVADTTTYNTDFFLYGNNFKTDSYGNVTGPGNPQGAYYQRGWYQFQRF